MNYLQNINIELVGDLHEKTHLFITQKESAKLNWRVQKWNYFSEKGLNQARTNDFCQARVSLRFQNQ